MHSSTLAPTPLIAAHVGPLASLLGGDGPSVLLKLDNLQPSGSFKDRGILHLCSTHAAKHHPRPVALVSSSGGNAGLAVAHAALVLGGTATVFVPTSTADFMRAKLTAAGADVRVAGSVWAEANAAAMAHMEHIKQLPAHDDSPVPVFVHPFDDPLLWDGHSSVVAEVAAQLPETVLAPAAIVCAVGGGGLFSGVCAGIRAQIAAADAAGNSERAAAWRRTRVVAAETCGADCLAQSVAAGTMVTLPAITSIAKSLGASAPCARAFTEAHEGTIPVSTCVVTDQEAARAAVDFADHYRYVVEPACGAALAATIALVPTLGLASTDVAVTIVCGGSLVQLATLVQQAATAE
ncbi:tryptophan synthase beta subunit-like PLP-dependent enzyme [Blastocladiella britannica]|nr:tryptophan synthase beta subunit-like PLP-dependent enzyme [Blastocladiella britannica]